MKLSPGKILHTLSFLSAIALAGLAIGIIVQAANAFNVFDAFFPSGMYDWVLPQYPENRFVEVRFAFNRSSEIKTFVSAAVCLLAGLVGVYAFLSAPKRTPTTTTTRTTLLVALTATITSIACVASAAVGEARENRKWCFIDNIAVNQAYMCTIEHSVCSALRFTTEGRMYPADYLCGEIRKTRTLMVPLAIVACVMLGLYAAGAWVAKKGETEEERAERRAAAMAREEA